MARKEKKTKKRQSFSFWIRPEIKERLDEYVQEHGLVTGILLERLIDERINKGTNHER